MAAAAPASAESGLKDVLWRGLGIGASLGGGLRGLTPNASCVEGAKVTSESSWEDVKSAGGRQTNLNLKTATPPAQLNSLIQATNAGRKYPRSSPPSSPHPHPIFEESFPLAEEPPTYLHPHSLATVREQELQVQVLLWKPDLGSGRHTCSGRRSWMEGDGLRERGLRHLPGRPHSPVRAGLPAGSGEVQVRRIGTRMDSDAVWYASWYAEEFSCSLEIECVNVRVQVQ